MASSINANRIVQSAFLKGFSETQGLAARVAGPAIMIPGAASYNVSDSAIGGIGATLARGATSVPTADHFTWETSFATVHKVINHVVKTETLNSDTAYEQAGRKLAQSAIATLDKGFFDGMEALFAADHPRVGTGAGQVGATKKYLDSGLKILNGESGEATFTNLATAALAEAALYSGIKALMAQKDDRGIPLHLGAVDGFILVCDPSKADVAHELVKSQLSGSDMASNFAAGRIVDVVTYPLTTDADDWFLVAKSNCPVGLAVSQQPEARISYTTNGLFAEFTAEVAYTFWRSPGGFGIYGSNVA